MGIAHRMALHGERAMPVGSPTVVNKDVHGFAQNIAIRHALDTALFENMVMNCRWRTEGMDPVRRGIDVQACFISMQCVGFKQLLMQNVQSSLH